MLFTRKKGNFKGIPLVKHAQGIGSCVREFFDQIKTGFPIGCGMTSFRDGILRHNSFSEMVLSHFQRLLKR